MAFSNQTVTYSESVQGFPSFYSYIPEKIIGMNGFLYTFKNGKLYQHNDSTVQRNEYYGVRYDSEIKSVFNESPLENKIFKTIGIQSDDSWSCTLTSDIQTTGTIDGNSVTGANFFEKKEGEWFAYLRNNDANPISGEFPLRSVQGIAQDDETARAGQGTATCSLTFAAAVELGSMINQGDIVYYTVAPFTGNMNPVQAGAVVSVNNTTNVIVVNNTGAGTSALPATNTAAYIMYIKSQVGESNGIIGHYGEFCLTNSNPVAVELFAVDSDIMKSFP